MTSRDQRINTTALQQLFTGRYLCPIPACAKSFDSLGAKKAHIKLKHSGVAVKR